MSNTEWVTEEVLEQCKDAFDEAWESRDKDAPKADQAKAVWRHVLVTVFPNGPAPETGEFKQEIVRC